MDVDDTSWPAGSPNAVAMPALSDTVEMLALADAAGVAALIAEALPGRTLRARAGAAAGTSSAAEAGARKSNSEVKAASEAEAAAREAGTAAAGNAGSVAGMGKLAGGTSCPPWTRKPAVPRYSFACSNSPMIRRET